MLKRKSKKYLWRNIFKINKTILHFISHSYLSSVYIKIKKWSHFQNKQFESDFDRDIYLFNPRVDKIDKKDQLIAKLIDDNFGKNVKFISVLEELCTNQKCLAVKGDGLLEPFTFDYGHLTLSGSMEVVRIIHKNAKH